MSEFKLALEKTLLHEGGYSDHVSDPGGATNKGITQRTYDSWRKRQSLDVKPVRQIEDWEVETIYLQDYWYSAHAEKIESQPLAEKYFDFAVNMGLHQACRLLQKSCCDCGNIVTVDGLIGENTLHAVKLSDPGYLLEILKANAKEFYQEIVSRNPSRAVFLKGWLARATA